MKTQKPSQPLLISLHRSAGVVAGLDLLPPPMEQPLAHSLSFDNLEMLVLVEGGGATPRDVADCFGMDLEETKALVDDISIATGSWVAPRRLVGQACRSRAIAARMPSVAKPMR